LKDKQAARFSDSQESAVVL